MYGCLAVLHSHRFPNFVYGIIFLQNQANLGVLWAFRRAFLANFSAFEKNHDFSFALEFAILREKLFLKKRIAENQFDCEYFPGKLFLIVGGKYYKEYFSRLNCLFLKAVFVVLLWRWFDYWVKDITLAVPVHWLILK